MSLAIFKKENIEKIIAPVAGLLVAFVVCSILMLAFSINPLTTFSAIFKKAFFTPSGIAQTLITASPVLLCGVGIEITKRAGIINLGAEGQMLFGAVGAQIAAGFTGNLPPVLAVIITLIGGIIFGALWILIPTVLRVGYGISEVVVLIMTNQIASYLVAYLVRSPLKDPSSSNNQAAAIPESAWLYEFTSGIKVHVGIFITLIMIFLVFWILKRTTYGYELEVVGKSGRSASYAGISIKRIMIATFLIGGGLAGLAGAIQVSGVHHRLTESSSGGYGWTGMMIAMVAGSNPILLILVAILYSALDVGNIIIQITDKVPTQLADIIQVIIVLSVISAQSIYRRRKESKK